LSVYFDVACFPSAEADKTLTILSISVIQRTCVTSS
jgi:hypothetical protein